jgi:hypothetical protein
MYLKIILPAVILNALAGEVVVQINVQASCHALILVRGSGRWRQGHFDSKRMQDRQRFSDLAGFLASFEIDDEP